MPDIIGGGGGGSGWCGGSLWVFIAVAIYSAICSDSNDEWLLWKSQNSDVVENDDGGDE